MAFASPGLVPWRVGSRARMERGLGRSLAGVRVHDPASSPVALPPDHLGAAVGRDVVVDAAASRRRGIPPELVLAHELAHTAQQERGGAPVSEAVSEREADGAAVGAMRRLAGGNAPAPRMSSGGMAFRGCEPVPTEVEGMPGSFEEGMLQLEQLSTGELGNGSPPRSDSDTCDYHAVQDSVVQRYVDEALEYSGGDVDGAWARLYQLREKNCCDHDMAAAEQYLYMRKTVGADEMGEGVASFLVFSQAAAKVANVMPRSGVCPTTRTSWDQIEWGMTGIDEGARTRDGIEAVEEDESSPADALLREAERYLLDPDSWIR